MSDRDRVVRFLQTQPDGKAKLSKMGRVLPKDNRGGKNLNKYLTGMGFKIEGEGGLCTCSMQQGRALDQSRNATSVAASASGETVLTGETLQILLLVLDMHPRASVKKGSGVESGC